MGPPSSLHTGSRRGLALRHNSVLMPPKIRTKFKRQSFQWPFITSSFISLVVLHVSYSLKGEERKWKESAARTGWIIKRMTKGVGCVHRSLSVNTWTFQNISVLPFRLNGVKTFKVWPRSASLDVSAPPHVLPLFPSVGVQLCSRLWWLAVGCTAY